MAQKVTAMDIRAAAALAGEIGNVAEFCRMQQISRVTFYKLRMRFLAEGWEGLAQDRSRRPASCPTATDAAVVACRVELAGAGLDHGPQSIVWTLRRRGVARGAVAGHGGADSEQPGPGRRAAAETSEIGDQAVRVLPAQRVLAVRLDRMALGRPHRGGHRGQHRRPLPVRARVARGCGGRYHRAGMGGDPGRDRRVRGAVDVVVRQRIRLHRPVSRLRVDVRSQPARAGGAHHQLHPVSPADLRQNRTVLADAEEVARRPATGSHHRRAQRPARDLPRALPPPTAAPGAAWTHSLRGVRRHREGPSR
jgi:hypothetical protein